MLVQAGDGVAIGGFIITGTDPKQVALRGIGPSLSCCVPNALADPVLELHGPSGFATVINDNACLCPPCPQSSSYSPCIIPPPGIAPTNDLESLIYLPLDPGAYTVILRGNGNPVGVGLVEIYDLSQSVSSKLANLSTRAFVNTGNEIVIAGFIIGGNDGNDQIVVRGLGPSLVSSGVPNALGNPTLELRGSQGTIILANDNWQDDPAQAAELIALGLAPANNLEAGMIATVSPGAYTALLSGVNNGMGVGLVEVYDRGVPAH
jgi:hypothetical protein